MIKFGTDGWRGVIAEDFTFDNVRLCAQAVASYLRRQQPGRLSLAIGYDTRFASDGFAKAAAEVFAANGILVYLCTEPTPTPVVSYMITALKATGGVVITASHNPPLWNGFKYKTGDGGSAPRAITSEIEAEIAQTLPEVVKSLPLEEGVKKGLVKHYDPRPDYVKHIAGLVDIEKIRRSRLKVVVDVMYGAGIGYLGRILQGGTMEVVEIDNQLNPLFPGFAQPEPIARNLTQLVDRVAREKADVGLANDGDADRIGIIDEEGGFLNPHQVFSLLTLYLLEVRGQRGPIIKTVSSSQMINALGQAFGVPVFETRIGFPYIAPLMLEKEAVIGGEESGGYGFKGHVPERDGIFAGLCFLDLMVSTGKSPSQLVGYLYSKVGGPHYYDRNDFHLTPQQQERITGQLRELSVESLDGLKVVKSDRIDGLRLVLSDGSWLLIRPSGTEPLLRVYGESRDKKRLSEMLDAGKRLVGL